MTRIEALELLGLAEGTPPDAITGAYTEMFNDYQLRLTNAPTPNLKKLYHRNLEELNLAKRTLLGETQQLQASDLPSSVPVYMVGSVVSSVPSPSEGVTLGKEQGIAHKRETPWAMLATIGVTLVLGSVGLTYFLLHRTNEDQASAMVQTDSVATLDTVKHSDPRQHTTDSGLQYEVLIQGFGPKPTPSDRVRIHYVCYLTDGKEVDSSYSRNEPVESRASDLIPGLSEAVQLMTVGSRWRLYLPAYLAYGPDRIGATPPNSDLVYDLSLIAIVEH